MKPRATTFHQLLRAIEKSGTPGESSASIHGAATAAGVALTELEDFEICELIFAVTPDELSGAMKNKRAVHDISDTFYELED